MNDIRRSRRLRLPRRRYQLNKPLTSDEDDDEQTDHEHDQFQRKSMAKCNKNANRTATTLFNPIPKFTMEEKQQQQQLLAIVSDPSSLFLYSIRSGQKHAVSHSDLTALTRTATNTTSLTALPCSDSKMTDTGVVKIDLTDLSEIETLDSSPTTSGHDRLSSFHRKISQTNTDHLKDLTQIDETDISVKSIIFSKDHSFDQERVYPQHNSCIIIPNEDRIIGPSLIIQTNETNSQQSSTRWNLRNMTNKMKFLIGCTSLSFIAGILMLVLIL